MAHDCIFSRQVKEAQTRLFRIACDPRRHGFTIKAISDLSGIPYSTVRSYAGHNEEPHEMPLSAWHKLATVLPLELFGTLAPQGFHLVRESDCDLDELNERAGDFRDAKARAHREDSPAGPAICPDAELPDLKARAAALKAVGS